MSSAMDDLGISQLSLDRCQDLMHEISDSMVAADPGRSYLTEAGRRELERRLAEYEAHPDNVVPWEDVKAEALRRLEERSGG